MADTDEMDIDPIPASELESDAAVQTASTSPTPAKTSPASNDDDQEDTSDEEEEEDGDGEPSMVASRPRRSNAGNRMSTLLALADADDEEQAIYGDDTWAERVDDAEFGGAEAEDQGDVSLESSSDDSEDDENEDELAGEKALNNQERVDRAKLRKNKAPPLLQTALRKRIKINDSSVKSPSTPGTPSSVASKSSARPKKKSERVSWLPTTDDGPVRSSTRTLTKKNTAHTHQQLRKREQSAVQIREAMEAAQRRREAAKPKTMTQEERLAEAAKVEIKNSKSLYKWEEAENRRAAERQALLDSMRSRAIEGPYVRYYSGPAKWQGDKLIATGKRALIEVLNDDTDKKKEDDSNKDKEAEVVLNDVEMTGLPSTTAPQDDHLPADAQPTLAPSEPQADIQSSAHLQTQIVPTSSSDQELSLHPQASQPEIPQTENPVDDVKLRTDEPEKMEIDPHQIPSTSEETPNLSEALQPRAPTPSAVSSALSSLTQARPAEQEQKAKSELPRPQNYGLPDTIMFPPPESSSDFLSGIMDWAANPEATQQPSSATPTVDGAGLVTTQPPSSEQQPPSMPEKAPTAQTVQQPTGPQHNLPAPINPTTTDPPQPQSHIQSQPPQPEAQTHSPPPPAPIHITLRNHVILENISLLSSSTRTDLFKPLLISQKAPAVNSKARKLEKPTQAICCITSKPAKYRDPKTGLAYRDGFAYKCVRRLVGGGCGWSEVLGAYVGGVVVGGAEMGTKPVKGVPEGFWNAEWKPMKKEIVKKDGEKEGEKNEDKDGGAKDKDKDKTTEKEKTVKPEAAVQDGSSSTPAVVATS